MICTALLLLLILVTNSTKPRLLCHTVDETLSIHDSGLYSMCRASLPVELAHFTTVHSTQTSELVFRWPASTTLLPL